MNKKPISILRFRFYGVLTGILIGTLLIPSYGFYVIPVFLAGSITLSSAAYEVYRSLIYDRSHRCNKETRTEAIKS